MIKKFIFIALIGVLGSFWYIWNLGESATKTGTIVIPTGANFASVVRLT